MHPDKTKIQNNIIGYGIGVKKARRGDIMVEVLSCDDHTMYLGRAMNLPKMDDEDLTTA